MFVLLYLGPETIMPVASILATIVGFLLIFWRLIVRSIKGLIRIIRRQPAESVGEEEQPITVDASGEDTKIQ